MLRIYNRRNMPSLLFETMHKDRASQFVDRLKWAACTKDVYGREFDAYDHGGTLYICEVAEDGTHMGSLRLLPTTGPTMTNDVFYDLLGGPGRVVRSPRVWEVTRFCLSDRFGVRDSIRTSTRLSLMCHEFGVQMDLRAILAVFDRPMLRVYAKQGNSPVPCLPDDDDSQYAAGLWYTSPERVDNMCRIARTPRETLTDAYKASLPF